MTKKTKKTKAAKAAKKASAAAAPEAAAPATTGTKAAPAPISVEARAHEIWMARGRPVPGTPLADWLQAEREVGVRKTT